MNYEELRDPLASSPRQSRSSVILAHAHNLHSRAAAILIWAPFFRVGSQKKETAARGPTRAPVRRTRF